MRFDIMTLFPTSVDAMMQESILGRAQRKGLALSAKIAEIHHTHLEYASRPETGTMVTITLKMVEEDEEEG